MRKRVQVDMDRTEMGMIWRAAVSQLKHFMPMQNISEFLDAAVTLSISSSFRFRFPFFLSCTIFDQSGHSRSSSLTKTLNIPISGPLPLLFASSSLVPPNDSCLGIPCSRSFARDLDRRFWNHICNVFGRISGPKRRARASLVAASGFLYVSGPSLRPWT